MSTKKPKSAGKDLLAFRQAHDDSYRIPRRIADGLKELGDAWEYELDFLRRTGISTTAFAKFRDQFDEHCVTPPGRNPKRVWCGTVAFAKKLRETVQ